MSEPKRYHIIADCGWNEAEASDGEFVRWEDYARLKAEFVEIRKLIDKRMVPLHERTTLEEVERICSAHLLMGITINKIGNLNILLEAQVERLTKAGDDMAKLMFIDKDYIGSPKQEAVVEWCKATEGKQP